MCYSGLGFAERQILFSDVNSRREIDSRRQWGYGTCYGGIVSPLRRSVVDVVSIGIKFGYEVWVPAVFVLRSEERKSDRERGSQASILPSVYVLSSEERKSDREGVRLLYYHLCLF